jgi:RNase adapter protein RapZ
VFELGKPGRGKRRACRGEARAAGLDVVQRRVRLEELDRERAPLIQKLLEQRLQLRDEGVGAFRRKEFHMSSLRIVFVTGLSGAGLSQAIKSFEDLGFYCIEHLPPAVLNGAIAALERSDASDVAIALDLRSGKELGDPGAAIDDVMRSHDARLLFLDASNDLLVRRFSETRRRHPFAQGVSTLDAIEADRQALAPLRERADVIIDTSTLTPGALKERIAAAFLNRLARLNVIFVSFGFKYGLPADLDLLFDVRFLRNPNYEAALAAQTGEDAAVGAFIEDDPSLAPFLAKVSDLLDYSLPRYLTEGKSQLTVGIGCTGGRHRSVYVARRLMQRYAEDPRLDVAFEARDLVKGT